MSLCGKCLLEGKRRCKELIKDCKKDIHCIGCENHVLATSIMFSFLINYLRQNTEVHVAYIMNTRTVSNTSPLLLLKGEVSSDPVLHRIHIKYISSYEELNQFILCATLAYSFDMIVIDHWNHFYSNGFPYVNMNKTIALLRESDVNCFVIDNSLTATKFNEKSNIFSSLYTDVLLVKNCAPFTYQISSLKKNVYHPDVPEITIQDKMLIVN